jgi:hypothetical protein
MTPTPGDITHRIGPSVPSPSLPARSYSFALAASCQGPWWIQVLPRSLDSREPLPY